MIGLEVQKTEQQSAQMDRLEENIARRVLDAVTRFYPKIKWQLEVDIPGGRMVLRCPMVSHRRGYTILFGSRSLIELEIRAASAAGEILERHKIDRKLGVTEQAAFELPRHKARPDEVNELVLPDAAPERDIKQVH